MRRSLAELIAAHKHKRTGEPLAVRALLSNNHWMHSVLMIVLIAAIALFVLGGLLSSMGDGSVYDQIGKGGLSMDGGRPQADPAPDSSLERAERDDEIRQMLKARSERRVRQGAEPLDIEAELMALTDSRRATGHGKNAEVTQEIRQLVIARNARRERQGQPPLDVEAEVARTLDELGA